MTDFVIDASVAVKWVVEETGTKEALALRRGRLSAPDLLVAECANILWKKTRLKQLTQSEANAAAQLLTLADIELVPMRPHWTAATMLAIELDHPAYDCLYLALAMANKIPFVTADERLLCKARQSHRAEIASTILNLPEAAALT